MYDMLQTIIVSPLLLHKLKLICVNYLREYKPLVASLSLSMYTYYVMYMYQLYFMDYMDNKLYNFKRRGLPA